MYFFCCCLGAPLVQQRQQSVWYHTSGTNILQIDIFSWLFFQKMGDSCVILLIEWGTLSLRLETIPHRVQVCKVQWSGWWWGRRKQEKTDKKNRKPAKKRKTQRNGKKRKASRFHRTPGSILNRFRFPLLLRFALSQLPISHMAAQGERGCDDTARRGAIFCFGTFWIVCGLCEQHIECCCAAESIVYA